MEEIKQEYKVKVKDNYQNTTHYLTERATSQNEANEIALRRIRKMLSYPQNSDYLEIK